MSKPDLSKATPRPWRFDGDMFIQPDVACMIKGRDQRQANAALIVAAVNAYDAARESLQRTVGTLQAMVIDNAIEKEVRHLLRLRLNEAQEVLRLMDSKD